MVSDAEDDWDTEEEAVGELDDNDRLSVTEEATEELEDSDRLSEADEDWLSEAELLLNESVSEADVLVIEATTVVDDSV